MMWKRIIWAVLATVKYKTMSSCGRWCHDLRVNICKSMAAEVGIGGSDGYNVRISRCKR